MRPWYNWTPAQRLEHLDTGPSAVPYRPPAQEICSEAVEELDAGPEVGAPGHLPRGSVHHTASRSTENGVNIPWWMKYACAAL